MGKNLKQETTGLTEREKKQQFREAPSQTYEEFTHRVVRDEAKREEPNFDESFNELVNALDDYLEPRMGMVNIDEGSYIVSRRIDSKAKTIVITVEPYTKSEFDRLTDASTFENSDEDLLNLDSNLKRAMTTARVYKRAYEELFYQGYEVEILIKGGENGAE